MKNDFYLYSAFKKACFIEGIAPSVWMNKNGFSSSTSTAMKNGARPSADTLKALTSNWLDKESGLRILEAYIKDEIERCGYSLDQISPKVHSDIEQGKPEDGTLDSDLRTVQQFMNRCPIRDSIHAVAVLFKHCISEDKIKHMRRIMAQDEIDAATHKTISAKPKTRQTR